MKAEAFFSSMEMSSTPSWPDAAPMSKLFFRPVVFVNLLPLPINPSIDNHVQGVLFLRDGSESLMYAYLESRTAISCLVESYYGICGLKNVREFEFK